MIRKKISDLIKSLAKEFGLDHLEGSDESYEQKLVSSLTKGSSRLQKMSRPRITFPNYKNVTTRPDQDVQIVETQRQKDLFGRKVAQDAYPDKIANKTNVIRNQDGTMTVQEAGQTKVDYQKYRDKQADSTARRLGTRSYGLNYPGKKASYSAAIAGKLRSKFETDDGDYKSKLEEHKRKTAEVVGRNNEKIKEYNKKFFELQAQKGTPEGREAYMAHIFTKPVLEKKPRKPSPPKKDTSKLSPEAMKQRGQTTESTIEHEGFHRLLDDVERKHGKKEAIKLQTGILNSFDPEVLGQINSYVSKVGYKRTSPGYGEELITHARDILTNPKKREDFKAHVGKEKFDDTMKKLKQSWQKAYNFSQTVKPEAAEVAGASSGQIAADKK